MSLRNTRVIILLFAIFLLLGGLLFRYYEPVVEPLESISSIFIVSIICLALYGLSFLKFFSKNKNYIVHTFQAFAAIWLITLTAINHFLPDYAYSLVFTVIMLGLMFDRSKNFALFYSICFVLLLVLSFFEKHSLIELKLFDTIFFIAGAFIYFILKIKEKTNEELGKAQVSAKSILHSSLGFFFFLDNDYKIKSFNNYAEVIYRKEMHMQLKEGIPIFNYMPEDTHESLRQTLNSCSKGEIIRNEKQVNYTNGLSVWAENTFVPVYDDNKKFLGISFQTNNITERKKTEEALLDSEARFRQLAESAFEGLLIHDNGIIKDVNTQLADLVGYPSQEIIGRNILDFAMPLYHELMLKGLRVPYEIEVINKNGYSIPIEIRVKPFIMQGKFVTVAAIRDLRERKKAEAALKESEQRFKELADNLPLMIYEIDANDKIIYFNKASHAITGYSFEDYKNGVNFTDMFPASEKERAVNNVNKIKKGNSLGMIEYTMKRKDGSLYTAIFNTVPILKDGNVIGRRGVVTDITKLKDAEDKIIASLKEKEIGRAQNEKSKEYFSVVWRACRAVAGLASLLGVLLKKSSNINQKTPPIFTFCEIVRNSLGAKRLGMVFFRNFEGIFEIQNQSAVGNAEVRRAKHGQNEILQTNLFSFAFSERLSVFFFDCPKTNFKTIWTT